MRKLELRQDLGNFWETLLGLSIQANVTLINAEVQLPDAVGSAVAIGTPGSLVLEASR